LNDSRAKNTWIGFDEGMHNDTCMQPGYFTAIRDYLEGSIVKSELDQGYAGWQGLVSIGS
jgi:hypothetical protein